MIEFMVIGPPRSGTTWAANWLTTDESLCLHDPLYHTHYKDWDAIVSKCRLGISCTGIWRWADWVNSHPSNKLILHRDIREINESLAGIGLPEIEAPELSGLEGLHVEYRELFNPVTAERIWKHLGQGSFNEARHKNLCEMEIQPAFEGLSVGKQVTRKLLAELASL